MIRGISFNIEQTTSSFLWEILKCIDVKKYIWYNIDSQTEVFDELQLNKFFTQYIYEGEAFEKKIQEKYFIVFLKIQAYSNMDCFENITTYQEFLNSQCQFMLLIYDCEFVEFFSKNESISKTIYRNAMLNNYFDVKYITDENDMRTTMNIL